MKFVCERCHTKYSIADEKVRGKVLKVRCKSCENVITVRETGATIDDRGTGAKEAPIARSGTLEGSARYNISPDSGATSTVGVAAPARRVGIDPRKSAPAMPAAAFLDPGAPAAAPPPRRRMPTPMPLAALAADDGIDWYMAVDGAQTGPFRRAMLVDKILAVPAGGDIHVWNAKLGAWKPPKDVPDVLADLTRRRRPGTGAHPVQRRPSGAMAVVSAPRAVPEEISEGHSASNGVSAFSEDADTQISKGPPVPWKRNGVAAAPAAEPAHKAAPAAQGFALDDLFKGDEAAHPTPGPTAAAAAFASSAGVAVSSPGLAVSGAPPRSSGRPVKLIVGLIALVAIVCGIVAVAMLRKPAAPVAAAPASPPPPDNNFANLAEKLANEQAAAKPAPAETPPPVDETKPLVAKIEPPVKGGKSKGHPRKGQPGVAPTTPPPMTAEQSQAAARFGEASTREVRAASSSGSSARSMPAQSDISRVINNNRQGIQTCYQRALLRDSTLTQGKVTVRVSIGLSGKVKSVSLDAPAQFRSMESCVKDVMSRWAFPPSSEEYGTEFPVVLQGNQ
jgi:predicted Zn finger-like uncharacterized protein